MSRKSLDQTLEFMQSVDRARTDEELCGSLLQISRRFGFAHVLAGTIPRAGASRTQQLSHVVLADWPDEWARRYFTHGYLFVDPTIRRVSENRGPFFWSELEGDYADDKAARRVMNEAGDFRLRCGLTVPVTTLEGEIAGFSLAGEHADDSPATRGLLTLLATYALARSFQLRRGAALEPSGPPLTQREREALQWAAEGRTDVEIGELMRITEHGVDRHMRSAKKKLATRTRTHAVAEAIRLGWIR